MRLVLDDDDRAALAIDCPRCQVGAGTACLRSGGAVHGGSRQRFGEYGCDARLALIGGAHGEPGELLDARRRPGEVLRVEQSIGGEVHAALHSPARILVEHGAAWL